MARNSYIAACPFCGSDKIREDCVPNTQGTRRFMWCLDCSTHGPWSVKDSTALEQWNKRVFGPNALPEGWQIKLDHENKQAIVTHPNIGGYAACDRPENIAATMLYWLAVALVRSPCATNSEGEKA